MEYHSGASGDHVVSWQGVGLVDYCVNWTDGQWYVTVMVWSHGWHHDTRVSGRKLVFAQVRVPRYTTHKTSVHLCAAWCLADGQAWLKFQTWRPLSTRGVKRLSWLSHGPSTYQSSWTATSCKSDRVITREIFKWNKNNEPTTSSVKSTYIMHFVNSDFDLFTEMGIAFLYAVLYFMRPFIYKPHAQLTQRIATAWWVYCC